MIHAETIDNFVSLINRAENADSKELFPELTADAAAFEYKPEESNWESIAERFSQINASGTEE